MRIAITGKMCSGKSTLAKYICSLDDRYEIHSFGQKVKDVASDLFQMDPLHKDRTLLTSIGTKMREIDPDVWTKYIINKTKNLQFGIVDDLRYQNEYDYLVDNNFKIIQMNVSPELQEQRLKKVYPLNYQDHLNNRNHPSELNTFQWRNNGPDLIIDSALSVQKIQTIINGFIIKQKTLEKVNGSYTNNF